MAESMTDGDEEDRSRTDDDAAPSATALYEEMEVLEPYTTGELATAVGAPKRRVRRLLERLAGDETIRKKVPEPERIIWIRDAPTDECPACGLSYEIKFAHPVLSAARFCPWCGERRSSPRSS